MSVLGRVVKARLQNHYVSEAAEKDRVRLEGLGFTVIPLDYPPELVFTRKQHEQLKFPYDYRPDFLVLKPYGPCFLWEVKYRNYDPGDAVFDEYFLVPISQYNMLRRWEQHFKIPVYISVWFWSEWFGYAKISSLSRLGEIHSQKHKDVFIKLPLSSLNTNLDQLRLQKPSWG